MVQIGVSKTLRSGALAKSAGVSPDTIRHYEKIGVLPRASRTDSGYRVYPAIALERVFVVQRALRIGFTLAELAGFFCILHLTPHPAVYRNDPNSSNGLDR